MLLFRPLIGSVPVFLVLLAVIALVGCDGGTDAGDPGDDNGEIATPVAATEVQPRELSRQLAVSATVQPRVQIRLASRADGTLDEVIPEVGDAVAEGEVLARLDVSEEQAELDRARAQEEDARRQYQRTRDLRTDGVASAAELQRDEVLLEVAESERRLWQSRVAFGEVKAPRDAVITARYVEPGEAVDARQTLFELAAMDELVMRPGVSELDVTHLVPGMAVPVRLDALPDNTLDAEIRRIFPMAAVDSRLVTVEVALPDDAFERGVRPGFLGRIRVAIDRREGVTAVPVDAVSERDGQATVLIIEEDHLFQREVEPGVTRGRWREIRSGLEEGDVVLASNPGELREGDVVRIVTWRNGEPE